MSDHVQIGGSVLSIDMNKLTTLGVSVAILSGCASAPVDVSTGPETASISAKGSCSLYGQFPPSYRAQSVIVDAGPFKMLVGCSHFVMFDNVRTDSLFQFVAEAGHSYSVSKKGNDCVQLLDITAGGQTVACEVYIWNGFEIHSTGFSAATIRTEAGLGRFYCKLRKVDGGSTTVDLLKVDAGPIIVDATCDIGGIISNRWRKSRFTFDVEAGHTYAFSKSDRECIHLLDITTEETVIACEPYEKIE